MKDDNDRLREGTLPSDPLEDAVRMEAGIVPEHKYSPFPTEALPEPIRSVVTEYARAIGCSVAYVVLPLLAGLAAAVGNTRRIKLKRSWFEVSVLWIAIIGESGTLKSPALEAALAPLRHLQTKAIERYLAEKKAYEERLERYLEAKRSRGPKLGPEAERPKPPIPWRILCSDITVEALASRLQQAPRGLLLIRDELAGWIRSFDQYRRTQGADVAHYLSMHRAGELLIDRKTDQEIVQVRRAAVSIVGGIQPRILTRVLGEEHLENGLAARLLLAWPPRVARSWTDEEVTLRTAGRLADLYRALLDLDFATDEAGDKQPIDLSLSSSGREAWIRFFNRHGLEQFQQGDDLAAAFSKLEGYCARLALLIHLIRCHEGDPALEREDEIDSASVEAAAVLTNWFACETERVYFTLGISKPESDSRADLLRTIAEYGGRISTRQLMRKSRRYRSSSTAARNALQDLVLAGRGMWVPAETECGGRPSEVFELTSCGGDGDKSRPRAGYQRRQSLEVPPDRVPSHAGAGSAHAGDNTGSVAREE